MPGINKIISSFLLSVVLFLSACKRLVQIPEPVNSITTSEAFSTEANATSAILGIYSDMANFGGGGLGYANGATTLFAGLSADELNDFTGGYIQYQTNTLLANDPIAYGQFWQPMYHDIYSCNAAIEGLQASSLPVATRTQLMGEARFIRAFCYFYLINLFGDVPLDTTSAWQQTSLLKRTPVATVYQQIISDLKIAQNSLAGDFSLSGGERIRANSWAATALLARVYLFSGDSPDAEQQATLVINNSGLFTLNSDISTVFLKNSGESILQLQVPDMSPWATQEGAAFIPVDTTSSPNFYLTSSLLSAFEPGDLRRTVWVDSTDYSGTYYYFPYKYKVMLGSQGNVTEYYTLLRLGEQYLIRAEARAIQNTNLTGAILDLDTLRNRANLPDLSPTLDQGQVLSAVAQERRIELVTEWGHRWLDLKRTGKADSVLSLIKSAWQTSAQLYPIPPSEIQADPNLKQNPGY